MGSARAVPDPAARRGPSCRLGAPGGRWPPAACSSCSGQAFRPRHGRWPHGHGGHGRMRHQAAPRLHPEAPCSLMGLPRVPGQAKAGQARPCDSVRSLTKAVPASPPEFMVYLYSPKIQPIHWWWAVGYCASGCSNRAQQETRGVVPLCPSPLCTFAHNLCHLRSLGGLAAITLDMPCTHAQTKSSSGNPRPRAHQNAR
jgi:hypothetical protein